MAMRSSAGLKLLLLLPLTLQVATEPERPKKAAKVDKEVEKIEQVVTGLLEAYRAGNYEVMSRYYAPNAVVVSGRYEPPLVGWDKIRQAYLIQEQSLKHVELVREMNSTVIERRGNLAWAYYRWSFVGQVRDQYMTTLGHTTLVLEKRKGNWVIVYNHSSAAIPLGPPQPAAQPPPPRP